MRARTLISWGCVFILAGLLLSTLPSCQSRSPIRVGFIANLTGPGAAVGVDGRDGVTLAVDLLNAQGGINQRPLELVVRNNMETPEGSIAAANDLIQNEKISIILGHMTSSMMVSAWEATQDSGVIYLSATASASKLTGMDDNFLRLTPATSAFAETVAEYATNELGLKKLAILYDMDNAAFTDIYQEAFAEKIISNGSKVVWRYDFRSSAAPDFKPIVATLKDLQPDGILIIASASDTALVTQQIRLGGCKAQILTSNWALTKDLIENGGTAVDGIAAIATYSESNPSKEYVEFSNKFEERFGRKPSFSASYGYEAALVLADALKKTKGEREGLKEALLGTKNFNGLFGSVSLDAYGDVRRTLYLVQVHDGVFKARPFPAP
jgi:branched-chain amino acid transport system substrate-binding protein